MVHHGLGFDHWPCLGASLNAAAKAFGEIVATYRGDHCEAWALVFDRNAGRLKPDVGASGSR